MIVKKSMQKKYTKSVYIRSGFCISYFIFTYGNAAGTPLSPPLRRGKCQSKREPCRQLRPAHMSETNTISGILPLRYSIIIIIFIVCHWINFAQKVQY